MSAFYKSQTQVYKRFIKTRLRFINRRQAGCDR